MTENCKVQKTVIHSGKKFHPITEGSRVYFHFVTKKCDENHTLIDDSRDLMGKPMTLVIGKQFKLQIWETVVKQMAINEVASFIVDKSLVYNYPFVSKTLRDQKNKIKDNHSGHCAGHVFQTPYPEVNELLRCPQNLEFIIVKVEDPGSYEQESWQLNEEDRLLEIPKLKEEGNILYKSKKYQEAMEKYSKALGFIEQLLLREKPGDAEWKELNDKKMPILLNYSQCKLLMGDYYEVIEHCTTILEHNQNNVKALYRRGKAHAAVWNNKEAKADFLKALELDKGLEADITNQLKDLSINSKEKESALKQHLQGKLF